MVYFIQLPKKGGDPSMVPSIFWGGMIFIMKLLRNVT